MSEEEIDRMVKEAELHKAEDDKRREETELRNKAEGLIIQIEDALKENGDKFDANQKAEVEKLKDELQQALNNNDYTTLKTKLDALEQAAQQMSQAMYQQQANNSSANNSNNDYMDADFKEKN